MSSQDVDASFLAMPRWANCNVYWKELTWKGKLLLRELRQLVSLGATDSTFEECRAHLEEWREYISNEEDKGKLPNGLPQWEVASQLLKLAKKAAAQPTGEDELLERARFPTLSAWEWDAFCAFLGMPRSAEYSVMLTALLIDEQTGNGITAQLTLERLANGTSSIYALPQEHAFLTSGEKFEGAIANAKAFVKEQGFSLDTIDVRWRLQRHDGRLLNSVGGPSIGGAFAMGLMKLMGGESQ